MWENKVKRSPKQAALHLVLPPHGSYVVATPLLVMFIISFQKEDNQAPIDLPEAEAQCLVNMIVTPTIAFILMTTMQ